ncbi:DUF3515 domain-containing protein [Corynebacterium poyangense]|uniref:DUF3515 domain-containing protein n=1 Tax=Corynebacterium poyangense TaxID=2684405 RepID=UPI0021CDDA8E|nr:DUF3515 domain-containing protein [Corynebacterium poyangense]
MRAESPSPFNRTLVYIALAIALSFVIGVLCAGRLLFQKELNRPIGMSVVPAPQSDSEDCRSLLTRLPDKVDGHPRAEIADPVPQGAAVWGKLGQRAVSLRCGVDLPAQYTTLSSPAESGGTQWLMVNDTTPGSTMRTFYSLNRSVVVALTLEDASAPDSDADTPPDDIANAVSQLPEKKSQPNPAPLSDLPRVPGVSQQCADLLKNLPETLGGDRGYRRVPVTDTGLEDTTDAAWTAPGLEPVVLRCGTEEPKNYHPGVQLQQVNNTPWFVDTEVSPGQTAGTWYALGRDVYIAVSMPEDVAANASVELGEAIDNHTASNGSR